MTSKSVLASLAIALVHFAATALWLMNTATTRRLDLIDSYLRYLLTYTTEPFGILFKAIGGEPTLAILVFVFAANSLMWGFGIWALFCWLNSKIGKLRGKGA
jgi:hypothetical protein